MARRRAIFDPASATSEGSRRLREILRSRSFQNVAWQLLCDEKSVRTWAQERGKPSVVLRYRLEDEFGIDAASWDEPPYCN